ncbi:YbaB/EbfC family nucleoid-associated protein [Glycomyces sp. NPDC048151]|uniref:YbaB/EbfC family nucleoid-associated protein n=1 Tax=Glycomyces sp. NPDC048151 TaxID=3364002 RepID=UPI00371B78BE
MHHHNGSELPETFDFAASMREFRDQMRALNERAERVRHLIEATSFRVESAGGEVAVTMTTSGLLVGIDFRPAADDMAPNALAATTLATYHRAAAAARSMSSTEP